MEFEERVVGSLLGLACGDALGATAQFLKPGTFLPVTDMVGGGSFGLQPGQWTDDTSLALCLASSLVECSGFNPRDQLQRYVRWWRSGYMSCTRKVFDIGGTTSSALARFVRTGDEYCGSDRPHSSGNGSLVRLAPVLAWFARTPVTALERAADSSRTTHGARNSVDACRLLGALLLGAYAEKTKDEILSPDFEPIPGYWKAHPLDENIEDIRLGSYKTRQPPAIRGNGYVVLSLEAALWALHSSQSFEEGALRAVNLGDDAASTGAVFGQLAGALYGKAAIPVSWWQRLAQRELIEELAVKLVRQAS